MIYPLLLLAGLVGLVVMAALGFLHAPGHHGHHHSVDVQHGHAHAGHAHSGHAPGGHVHGGHSHLGHAPGGHVHGGQPSAGHTHGGHSHDSPPESPQGDGPLGAGPSVLLRLMPFLSPLNWFGWMLGAGAAGSVVGQTLHAAEPLPAIAAVIGAIGFNQGVVKPILRLVTSFVSKPAEGLPGCLMQQVEATTAFNERGEGLVRVTIDGRSEDVLARLTDEELPKGQRIHRGDRLLIEDVDPNTNRCRVSRL